MCMCVAYAWCACVYINCLCLYVRVIVHVCNQCNMYGFQVGFQSVHVYTLADAGFKERGGVVVEGDHQKGEVAGGGCAPSRAKRGSF